MNTFNVVNTAIEQLKALEVVAQHSGVIFYTSREDYNSPESRLARDEQAIVRSEIEHHNYFLDTCMVDLEMVLEGDGLGKLLRRAAQEGVDQDRVLADLRELGLVGTTQFRVWEQHGNYQVERGTPRNLTF